MFEKQVEQIRNATDFTPEIAIVLGSGLGALADKIEIVATVPYSAIDDMPVSTAPSHKGQFVFGKIGSKNVVLMQGRVHMYEGYSASEVVMPLRILRALGAEKIILTNAVGGINRSFKAGDFMLISDYISLFIDSPLRGKNDNSIGERFPDMSNCFDKELQEKIKDVAKANNIDLKCGVLAQTKGPQFESKAEIKALEIMGADAVGMSTVIEAIAARHCGYKVCGISLITNMACGILDQPLSDTEVFETAELVAPKFEKLITEIAKVI